jgi:mannosyl-oligosaccharide glucosidase
LSDAYRQALLEHFWDDNRKIFDEFYVDNAGSKRWDGHFGYLNLWPLFLNVLDPSSEQFEAMVRKLLDRDNGIWTKFGLRSLSSKDPYFGGGDNYWTGPIWLNINFLVLSSFYKFVQQPDDYPMDEGLRSEIRLGYGELRRSIIDMVVENYSRTGYIWEVYSGDDGQGFNNHPFTGWSALVVNIMAEIY